MENNPLRQYFRRPAVYLKLPSGGKEYQSSVLVLPDSGEFPVYPMTAIDEITARTPDALFNGVAVVDLIKSCVPDIKDPWGINSNDLDSILIAIRAASGSDAFELESECRECKEKTSYNINLAGILSTLRPADYSQELAIRDLKIKFKPLTYKEMNEGALGQFDIQKTMSALLSAPIQQNYSFDPNNPQPAQDDPELVKQREKLIHDALEKTTHLTMELLANTVDYIKTPQALVSENEFILDFLKNCDRETYNAIREYNAKLKSETDLKPLDVKCPHCNHEYQQSFTLNPTDFFG